MRRLSIVQPEALDLPLLLVSTPAGFPSLSKDDMEEPVDLGAWLVEQPAASYVMRVDGRQDSRGSGSRLSCRPSTRIT